MDLSPGHRGESRAAALHPRGPPCRAARPAKPTVISTQRHRRETAVRGLGVPAWRPSTCCCYLVRRAAGAGATWRPETPVIRCFAKPAHASGKDESHSPATERSPSETTRGCGAETPAIPTSSTRTGAYGGKINMRGVLFVAFSCIQVASARAVVVRLETVAATGDGVRWIARRLGRLSSTLGDLPTVHRSVLSMEQRETHGTGLSCVGHLTPCQFALSCEAPSVLNVLAVLLMHVSCCLPAYTNLASHDT